MVRLRKSTKRYWTHISPTPVSTPLQVPFSSTEYTPYNNHFQNLMPLSPSVFTSHSAHSRSPDVSQHAHVLSSSDPSKASFQSLSSAPPLTFTPTFTSLPSFGNPQPPNDILSPCNLGLFPSAHHLEQPFQNLSFAPPSEFDPHFAYLQSQYTPQPSTSFVSGKTGFHSPTLEGKDDMEVEVELLLDEPMEIDGVHEVMQDIVDDTSTDTSEMLRNHSGICTSLPYPLIAQLHSTVPVYFSQPALDTSTYTSEMLRNHSGICTSLTYPLIAQLHSIVPVCDSQSALDTCIYTGATLGNDSGICASLPYPLIDQLQSTAPACDSQPALDTSTDTRAILRDHSGICTSLPYPLIVQLHPTVPICGSQPALYPETYYPLPQLPTVYDDLHRPNPPPEWSVIDTAHISSLYPSTPFYPSCNERETTLGCSINDTTLVRPAHLLDHPQSFREFEEQTALKWFAEEIARVRYIDSRPHSFEPSINAADLAHATNSSASLHARRMQHKIEQSYLTQILLGKTTSNAKDNTVHRYLPMRRSDHTRHHKSSLSSAKYPNNTSGSFCGGKRKTVVKRAEPINGNRQMKGLRVAVQVVPAAVLKVSASVLKVSAAVFMNITSTVVKTCFALTAKGLKSAAGKIVSSTTRAKFLPEVIVIDGDDDD